jgi:hypothetical protein
MQYLSDILKALKGKKLKAMEVKMNLGESEVLLVEFSNDKVLKVSASGSPEFGYALHIYLITKEEAKRGY